MKWYTAYCQAHIAEHRNLMNAWIGSIYRASIACWPLEVGSMPSFGHSWMGGGTRVHTRTVSSGEWEQREGAKSTCGCGMKLAQGTCGQHISIRPRGGCRDIGTWSTLSDDRCSDDYLLSLIDRACICIHAI